MKKSLICCLMWILAICLVACCCPSLVQADTCNCSQTGVCICRPGTCMCPNCPGSVLRQRQQATVVYQAAPVVQAPVVRVVPVMSLQAYLASPVEVPSIAAPVVVQQPMYRAVPPTYYYPQQQSSGCYQDAYGRWICPNSQQSSGAVMYREPWMTGGDWRRAVEPNRRRAVGRRRAHRRTARRGVDALRLHRGERWDVA